MKTLFLELFHWLEAAVFHKETQTSSALQSIFVVEFYEINVLKGLIIKKGEYGEICTQIGE